jgi:hypothetical protein
MNRTQVQTLLVVVACVLLALPRPAAGQRLLDEWRVRTTAGPEALARGAAAVFLNPAQVVVAGRGEVLVGDLRAPGLTGVDGLTAAVAVILDGRTTLGVGYEHMGVDGLEGTTVSPNPEASLDIGENRFAIAASHAMGPRARLGALVQYTRLPVPSREPSSIALGAGLEFQPLPRLPLVLAASGSIDGDDVAWLAGVELASGARWTDWQVRGQYGLAGSELEPGTTHRVTASGEWRGHVELVLGAAIEPDGAARTVQPVGGVELRLHRYRLGVVREQLANDFGSAWSFRFAVGF